MGPPPYDHDVEIMQQAQHAPIPSSREEAKQYLRVLEMRPDGKYSWRGEWLSLFPRYTELDASDLAAWNEWINQPQTNHFLDATIEECRRLAEISKHAKGYAVVQEDQSSGQEKGADGWIKGSLRIPTKQN